jgi:hypothetical protein
MRSTLTMSRDTLDEALARAIAAALVAAVRRGELAEAVPPVERAPVGAAR